MLKMIAFSFVERIGIHVRDISFTTGVHSFTGFFIHYKNITY